MFFHQVSPKIAGAFEREVTLITLVRFFSSMLSHVYFHLISFTATIATLITLERFLSSMRSHVYFHLTSFTASIAALTTVIGLLPSVPPLMLFQVVVASVVE